MISFWRWLTQPQFSTADPERRRQMAVLSWMLLSMIVLGVLVTFIPVLVEPEIYTPDNILNFISLIALTLLGVLYWLNRCGYYQVAAYSALGIITIAIYIATFADMPASFPVLNYLIIPVLFGCILIPLWLNAILVGVSFAVILLTMFIFDQPSLFSEAILYFALAASLILIIMRNRNLLERDRRLALAESEERFRKLFMEAPVGMALVDHSERFVRVNSLLCTLFGYSAAELEQMHYSDILDEQETHIILTFEARQRIEQRCRTKDGRLIQVSITASGMLEKNVYYSLLTLEDVTDYKRMEDEAREAEQLAAELSKQRELADFKARFLSIVSHEFRNPLAGILTSTDLLNHYHDRLTDDARRANFQRIYADVHRLNQMVDDLLEISRSENGQVKFSPVLINLEAFCRDILEEVRASTDNRHTLVFSHQALPDAILADTSLLHTILTNLLYNGIKYTPEGGEVLLHACGDPQQVVITVSDTGIGIPYADQPKIFEPFYRAQNVGGIKGSGLGLKIVQDYLRLHNGEISLRSDPGTGTTFTITLPLMGQTESIVC